VDGHKVGEVSIPAAGLSFSPDFSKLYVGTITPYVYIVDPTSLHVSGRIAFPASIADIQSRSDRGNSDACDALPDGGRKRHARDGLLRPSLPPPRCLLA